MSTETERKGRGEGTTGSCGAGRGADALPEEQQEEFVDLFLNLTSELLPETSLAELRKRFNIPEAVSRPEGVLEELGQLGHFRLESVEKVRAVLARRYARAPWFRALRRYQQRWIPKDHPFVLDVLRIVCESQRENSTQRPTEVHRWKVELEFLEMDDVEEADVPADRRVLASVCDPFSERAKDEGNLEWYIERFLRHPFVEQVRAREAAASVKQYGEALFESLFGLEGSDARRMVTSGIEQQTLQRIEVIGPSDFQGLHWEALRHPKVSEPLSTRVPIVRRPERPESRLGEFQVQMSESSTLNVLLVVARPGGRNDIAYRTLARPLFEECAARADLPVRIDLLRPPTFQNLDFFLNKQRAHGVRYHIVHLDMHGAVLTWEETVAGIYTNQFAYKQATKAGEIEVVKCEKFEGKRPLVFFEASKAEKGKGRRESGGATTATSATATTIGREAAAEAIDANRLGATLQTYGVPVVLIDACQSSKQDAGSVVHVDSSMASQLLQRGVRIVVGMAYTVTVDAARTLMCEVYSSLLGKDRTAMHRTICAGRKALLSQKERRVFYNQRIELEDWILPQVYGDADFQLKVQDETEKERIERIQRQMSAYQIKHMPRYGFFGRDLDFLEIERRILRNERSNVLLVRGMGGVGKTTLVEHLSRWWQQTRMVERVFYFGYDTKAWTRQQILFEIGRKMLSGRDYKDIFLPADEDGQQALVIDALNKARRLIVLDNLESVTLTHHAVANVLSEPEQSQVRRFVQTLVGGRTLVVLGSRGAEEWLRDGTFENNVYELGGLDDEAATSFASRVLEQQGVANVAAVLEDEDVQQVIGVLGGFPLPMAVVLSELKRRSAAEVRRALEAGGGGGGGGVGGVGVSAGLQLAGLDGVRMANKTENILACVDYSFCNFSRDDQRMLECLAPFTGVFWTDFLEQYVKKLVAQSALAGVQFGRFSEAIEELKQRGLAVDSGLPGLLRLQPVFPYLLRTRLAERDREVERAAIDAAFHLHYEEGVAVVLLHFLTSKTAMERQIGQVLAKMECENLVTAALVGAKAHVTVLSCIQAVCRYWDSTQQPKRMLDVVRRVIEAAGGVGTAQASEEFRVCLLQCRHIEGGVLLRLNDTEGAKWAYENCLELLKAMPGARRHMAVTHHQLGRVAEEQRQWQQAEEHYGNALEIKVEFNDRHSQAGTYHQLGIVASKQRQWQQAEEHYRKALEIAVEFNDRHSQAGAYHQLGMVAAEQRQWQQAEEHYRKALEIEVELNDCYEQADTYHQLGMVAAEQRQWQQAEEHYRKALEIYVEFNDRYEQAGTYHQLGIVAAEQRQWQQAEEHYRKALEIKVEFNDRHSQASTYHQLGMVAAEQRQWQQAEEHYRKALEIAVEFNDRHSQAGAYHQLGMVAAEQRQWQHAEERFVVAQSIFREYSDEHSRCIVLNSLRRLCASSEDEEVVSRVAARVPELANELEEARGARD